ncbi:MAG: hypothetical protein JNM21_00955 [Taibaiella sp.]|nr:hypothetical protein [Taibaiella sp.]
MKHLLKITLTLIAAVLFTAASAQTSGPVLKFEVNGKPVSFKSDELVNYNQFVPGDDNERSGNRHVLSVTYAPKSAYTLQIIIYTPPHTNPAAGKLPFVQDVFLRSGDPCPSVYLNLTKQAGKEYEFYSSKLPNSGSFEITKVAAGWVEGKFALDMPDQFDEEGEVLHIANGTFRFKIEKEEK